MKKILLILFLVITTLVNGQGQGWWASCDGTSWAKRMMLSYVSINSHYAFTQASKDTILAILSTPSVVTTYGPVGQNKTVCDFFLFFKNSNTTTALTTRTNTKTGATLNWWFGRNNAWDKWTQNDLPADTCKNGWVAVFSTDGFAAWTIVDINTNTFTTYLPSFKYFTSLVIFYCFSNSFSGTLPSFAACTSLTNFRCYLNSFSGTLPSFATCTSLVNFYCYSNSFSGTLPSFAACTSLTNFRCHLNSFSGTLPSFATCTSLVSFYCYSNSFSGTLPSFATCTSLVIFYCFSNSFSGESTNFGGNENVNVQIQSNSFTLNGTSSFAKAMTIFNASNNLWPIAEVNEFLNNMNVYYTANAPTADCTVTLTGAGMGIPTGGASNTDLLACVALWTAAGKTLTITVRTS